jgi:hypothetical protein
MVVPLALACAEHFWNLFVACVVPQSEHASDAWFALMCLLRSREELFKRREEQLRKQDLELQQQLIRFNKFLQENDSKTARAEKKATEEIKLREAKEKEILEREQELRKLTGQKDDMKIVLDKNLVYEKYLLSGENSHLCTLVE